MNEIGGFFDLELLRKEEFYEQCIKINSGRNALRFVLQSMHYETIHLPYFGCPSVAKAVKDSGNRVSFYKINENFEVAPDLKVSDNDAIVYINYYGLKSEYLTVLKSMFKNLIVDNTHAFFTPPDSDCHTIYSPRKFFGVPDGGYLSSPHLDASGLPEDHSESRFKHLLSRIEYGAEASYDEFKKNEEVIGTLPIRRMSNLTKKILSSIDYDWVRETRTRNFNELHTALEKINELELSAMPGPMTYPLMIYNEGVRDQLVSSKIFVPTYWPEVLKVKELKGSIEEKYVRYIIPLPIDQRYGSLEMKRIISIVLNCIKK